MKNPLLLISVILCSLGAKAQKIDSIYFNLYTDSLKKGALHFNYINVDAKLSDGSYIPLDTTQLKFSCSAGKMVGNVLQLDSNETAPFVVITATLRSDPSVRRETRIYVKKLNYHGDLKDENELIEGWRRKN